MNVRSIRTLVGALSAGLLVVALAACSSSGAGAGAGGAGGSVAAPKTTTPCPRPTSTTTVTFGSGTSLAFAPLLADAEEKGYFKADNLNVKFKTLSDPTAALTLLNAGKIDAAFGGLTTGFINAVSSGLNVRAVASQGVYADKLPQPAGFYVRSDLISSGKVKTAADLKGLTFGLQGGTGDIGNAGGYFLALLLRTGGLKLTDVTIKNVTIQDTDQAFKTKAIDAAFVPSPFSTIVESDHSAERFGGASIIANSTQGGLMFGPNLTVKNPVVGEALIRALQRAAQDLTPGYSKNQALLNALKAQGVDPGLAAKTPEYLFRPGLSWNPATLTSIQDVFHAYGHGVLTSAQNVPFSKITDEPLRKAAESSMATCRY